MVRGLSAIDRELLKHPHYYAPYKFIKPLVRQFAQPGMNYTLTSVPNTEIVCTGCQGQKIQLNNVHGHLITTKCGICNGSGVMSNRQEEGS